VQELKERYLNKEKVQRLSDDIEKNSCGLINLILGFLLYTGAHRGKALNAEWHNIDIEQISWFVPISKSGKPRYIVLNQHALSIATRARALQKNFIDKSKNGYF
jgi:integrase